MPVPSLDRRAFFGTLAGGLLAAPLAVEAQPTRIGLLAQDLQPGRPETFRDELQRLGYTEGRNITIAVRNASESSDRLPALAAELLQLKVAVSVTVNTPAARAAKKATSTVLIVIMRAADPVARGLVASLGGPGGNVTGLSFMPDELGAKGVEMLHEILPAITRVGSLDKADNPGALLVVTEIERRSVQFGLHFLRLPVKDSADFPAAFQTATRARTEALFVMDDGAMTKLRKELLEHAARHSLPVCRSTRTSRRREASSPTGRACRRCIGAAPDTSVVS